MSVLTDAFSVIVPRVVLDAKYPGGSRTFIAEMGMPECGAYSVCADANLVSVSFLRRDGGNAMTQRLVELKFMSTEYDSFFEFAYVDQLLGPVSSYGWFDWILHSDGYSYAWRAGESPGELAFPEGWTPAHSQKLANSQTDTNIVRRIQLSVEGGRESWLDLHTGEVGEGMARNVANVADEIEAKRMAVIVEALMGIIRQMLNESNKTYDVVSETQIAINPLDADPARWLFFEVRTKPLSIHCWREMKPLVPEHKLVEVADLFVRLNLFHPLCTFELDHATGKTRVKQGMLVEDASVTPQLLKRMSDIILYAAALYHLAMCHVVFRDMPAIDAIKDAKGSTDNFKLG